MQKRCGKSKNAPNTHQNRKELYISRTHLEGIPKINEAENMAKRPRNIHQKWQVKPARASKVFVFTLS